jgi:hypothetical protein
MKAGRRELSRGALTARPIAHQIFDICLKLSSSPTKRPDGFHAFYGLSETNPLHGPLQITAVSLSASCSSRRLCEPQVGRPILDWQTAKDMTVYKIIYSGVDEKPEIAWKCLKRMVGANGFGEVQLSTRHALGHFAGVKHPRIAAVVGHRTVQHSRLGRQRIPVWEAESFPTLSEIEHTWLKLSVVEP